MKSENLNADGKVEFGRIGAETGLTPAPILLSEGIITNPETNDGYGLVHIEARHGEQIRAAGYNSVVDFIEEVAKNYEIIREGNTRDGIQTYMLQLTDKHNNTLMVELSGDGTYWNINTAGIFKTSYGAKRNVVYNRHTTDKQPAETAGASLSGEQSGTTPSTSMNAPTQTIGDVSESKGSEVSANEQEKEGKSSSYSVTPHKYVTKRGKKLAMQLVKFDKELTKEQQRAANNLAKELKGWWSKDDGGFLMRDAESVEKLVSAVLDESGETHKDKQPLSLQDMAIATEQTEAEQEENPNANYKVGDTVIFLNSNKTARLKGKIVRVDKTESFGTEYEVESILVTDNGPGKGVTSRPYRYTILEGQIESKVAAQPQQTEQPKRLVSDERMEELKARLRKKLGGQMNMGVDPEILAIGAELAVGHIERGLTKFADYAKTMIEDLGDAIRPYLKAFYNAVRDMPEAESYLGKWVSG